MSYAPVLTEQQIARIRALSVTREVVADEVLYEPNDATPPVYVVLSGAISIYAGGSGDVQLVTTYTPGQFSGELLMITGRPSMYTCRVKESGALLELQARDLRSLIAKDTELSDIFMQAFLARRLSLKDAGHGNVMILGSKYSAETLTLREFLTRDGYPFTYVDLDADPIAQEFLDRFDVKLTDIPVVICNATQVLRNPTVREVADALGLNAGFDASQVLDVVVVGAGPAGLAAAVYAASEGLDVLVIEQSAPGGQAGSSSKIENYLGFPTGLSGNELASRAIAQSEKFGAQIMVARTVKQLNCDDRPYSVVLDDGETLLSRTIVLATGAQYNRPAIAGIGQFVGRGVHYNATFMEAQLCRDGEVVVIGGGNSAGQAAVFLAQHTSGVHMLVRSGVLADTMSRYLVQRIESSPQIHVHYGSELASVDGNGELERVSWMNKTSGEVTSASIRHVFVMTGASPHTEWLSSCVALDRKGFILSGRDLDTATPPIPWPLKRAPHMLETSLPGVFVVGDVRANNIKRVASAVGEGSIVIHMVHHALAES
jgi:thioredoxin reductase (NADPH)